MIALIVYRPEVIAGDGGFDPDSPFEGFEIVGIAPNHLAADALLADTVRRGREIGQPVETWQWLATAIPDSDPPVFEWHGWNEGSDVDPPEPGKEWLTITEDGEEYAVIVLRTDLDIFRNDPGRLNAARAAREIRANAIVRALNTMVERGDYP